MSELFFGFIILAVAICYAASEIREGLMAIAKAQERFAAVLEQDLGGSHATSRDSIGSRD